jgi:hypothetical protein
VKYAITVLLMSLSILAACTFTVQETRDPASIAATRTARPTQPLYEGRIRITFPRPLPPIAPQIAPNEASLLPTVTPTKASN